MSRRLVALFVAAFLVTGCSALVPGQDAPGLSGNAVQTIKYVHDDAHGVGCWVSYGMTGNLSIYCLPDAAYRR